MEIDLKRARLEELSDIAYEVHLGQSQTFNYLDIMILKFIGEYGYGASGNTDAAFMRAIGKACLAAWEPAALIFDFSALTYAWGDRLMQVFDIGADIYLDDPFPMALIVGEGCEEGIRTLLLGTESHKTIEETGWVFKEFSHSWAYIEKELQRYEGAL
ncbi:hypothetical protein ABEO75_08870 [Paenibacillus macerans]|uniref:hypothetical protein n=1 Tax=Paenibacillus macerans TaxID=44252 RepID=UPI002E22DCB1|nr:hypothetical protein [Paenibacillus macerans]